MENDLLNLLKSNTQKTFPQYLKKTNIIPNGKYVPVCFSTMHQGSFIASEGLIKPISKIIVYEE